MQTMRTFSYTKKKNKKTACCCIRKKKKKATESFKAVVEVGVEVVVDTGINTGIGRSETEASRRIVTFHPAGEQIFSFYMIRGPVPFFQSYHQQQQQTPHQSAAVSTQS
jgi:hypothetical protein